MIASLLFTRQLTTNTLLKLDAEVGGRAETFLLLAECGLLLGCAWMLRQPVSLEKTGVKTAV